jgi:hypothetical protein
MGKILFTILMVSMFFVQPSECREKKPVFSSESEEKEFLRETTELMEKVWKNWQDGLIVNNVEVNGGRGVLSPGGMSGPVMTFDGAIKELKTKNISTDKVQCFKAVTGAVADFMRSWQRGYRNENIPFPEGSSSSFSLTPCFNVPVSVASGFSIAERNLNESALYDYMLYRCPGSDKSPLAVFRALARAFCLVFQEWKENCFIEGIKASGGVAPAPAPMGTGPGPVRGARGVGGKLTGSYLNGKAMYSEIAKILSENRIAAE